MADEKPPKAPKTPLSPERKAVGARLTTARKKCGLTLEQVGEHFSIGRGTVWAWENGNGALDIYRFKELCKLYSVTSSMILNGEQEEWPFEKVDFERYDALDPIAQGIAQTRMMDEVEKQEKLILKNGTHR
jgi:transcriptional regulator with XRE-family HTH domain